MPLIQLGESGYGRPTRRSRKTRAELIDAALGVLREEGLGALTVRAITERADVGHGTFYHHFASAEEILAAVVEHSMRTLSEDLARRLSDADDKAWVIVESLASTFRMLSAHPALGAMLERPQLLVTAMRDAVEPYAREDVTALIEAGEIDAQPASRIAPLWGWLLVGSLTQLQTVGVDAREQEATLAEAMLRMVGLSEERVRGLLERLRSEGPRIAGAPTGKRGRGRQAAGAAKSPRARTTNGAGGSARKGKRRSTRDER